ncbi:hypothetical protein Tco_1334211 [Tanacetum coccineum]
MESVSIRHIQGVGYGVLEFLGVGTMFDIFQNILFPYSLNTAYCLSWIRLIGLWNESLGSSLDHWGSSSSFGKLPRGGLLELYIKSNHGFLGVDSEGEIS